jgi:hypothetical protein
MGCPVYVLDNNLQAGNKIPKWMPRARVGIYLGKSIQHARSILLVLNPRTGMVSPQFHIKVDDTFETIQGLRETTHETWREKCGFTRETSTKTPTTTSTNGHIRINDLENVTQDDLIPEIANAEINQIAMVQQHVLQNEGAVDNEINAQKNQDPPNDPDSTNNQPTR